MPGRYRDGARLDKAKRSHGREEIGFDLPETGFTPADQIHLVDSKHDARDTHQCEDRRMPARLLLQSVAGIDQHHRSVSVACAARHVAGVLVVSRAIDQHKTALWRIKIAPGHVDGYALLAFCDEAVKQKTVIEIFRSAGGFRCASHHVSLVVWQIRGIPQKPADQRRFAVIDGAACEDMNNAAVLRLLRRGGSFHSLGAAHQKYPSCFLRSMAPA